MLPETANGQVGAATRMEKKFRREEERKKRMELREAKEFFWKWLSKQRGEEKEDRKSIGEKKRVERIDIEDKIEILDELIEKAKEDKRRRQILEEIRLEKNRRGEEGKNEIVEYIFK